MLIFFLVVVTVFALVSWYVFSRGLLALKGSSYRTLFIWIFWTASAAFIIGQILERGEATLLTRIVTHIGSVWLSVFLYLLLFVIFTDIIRLVNHFFPFFPERISLRFTNGQILFMTGAVLSLSITIAGYFNARYPRVTKTVIETRKGINGHKELKVVFISDVHIGAVTGKKRINEMVGSINELNPDIVIFGGDLVDHNPRFVKAFNAGEILQKIKSKYGIFAVAGNHEFIGNAEISISYLEKYGIKYLRDTIITIGENIRIAGRDDRDKVRFTGENRKALNAIIPSADNKAFTILIDHQPVEYDKALDAGVDLMLSGHTHRGQLWPFGYITGAIYENDYGLIKKGNSYFYTSTGYGSWGPPVRTGNRPEIVEITIRFTGN